MNYNTWSWYLRSTTVSLEDNSQGELQIGSLAVFDEEVMHRNEGVLHGPPEVAEVRLPAADHGGESEDEVALADVVADAVAVHDEGAEAHEGLGGAAHLEAGKFKSFRCGVYSHGQKGGS